MNRMGTIWKFCGIVLRMLLVRGVSFLFLFLFPCKMINVYDYESCPLYSAVDAGRISA